MASKHSVNARLWNGTLVEGYWFAPDQEVDLPKHSHGDYQLGLALTHPGEYFYRRAYHRVPVGSVSIIHPDEVHSGCGFRKRDRAIEFWSFYVPPQYIRAKLEEYSGKQPRTEPFLAPIHLNPRWEFQLRQIYRAVMKQRVNLAVEMLWQGIIGQLFRQELTGTQAIGPEQGPGVRHVREFLDAHPERHATLGELAAIAKLSPPYLSRSFHRQVGLPLHRYQVQRRIDRAKRLLLTGVPPAEVARLSGFSQQSHFTRYFRELVQTGPAAYQAGHYGLRRLSTQPEA